MQVLVYASAWIMRSEDEPEEYSIYKHSKDNLGSGSTWAGQEQNYIYIMYRCMQHSPSLLVGWGSWAAGQPAHTNMHV